MSTTPAAAPTPPKIQLQMIWPAARLNAPPPVNVAEGYELRPYRGGDEAEFVRVMGLAGFTGWDDDRVSGVRRKVLPEGWFFAVHRGSGAVAATAMATHNPDPLHPFGGELGWVAGDPAHAGKGLGVAVCAAVVVRYLQAGYKRIYLRTDDNRLPAIKSYLKLGFEPFLFAPDMAARWRDVHAQLEKRPAEMAPPPAR